MQRFESYVSILSSIYSTRPPSLCHISCISMSSGNQIESDPFADPSVSGSQHDLAQDATLIVGRNASLTLGTDSLIVLGRFSTHNLKIPPVD